MGEGTLLVVIFGSLHLLGVGLGALLLLPLMRERQPELWLPPEEDDDDGGSDRRTTGPSRDPSPGGLPLPDAAPARVRLRGPGRLADRTPSPARRPAHRPERTPAPQRERS